jgi:hypothetical protein
MPRESEAFSLYATESPYTTRSVRAKINNRIAELLLQLELAPDWPGVQRRFGKLDGLREAIQFLEQVEDEGK